MGLKDEEELEIKIYTYLNYIYRGATLSPSWMRCHNVGRSVGSDITNNLWEVYNTTRAQGN